MTTVSIETYIDEFEHEFNRLVHVWQRWSSGHFHSIIWIRRCYNVSRLYFNCLDGELRTYREQFASYLRNIMQRIRNVLHVTGRRCYNIFQEHNSSFLKKMWQLARNVLQVTCRRFHNVSWTCCKSLEEDEMVQRIRSIWQVTWSTVYNVSGRSCKLLTSKKMLQISGTSCMLLGEDVTTYKEHLSSYVKKSLQRIRKVVQVNDK